MHCLRWPGSWHRKGEPRLCEIFTVNPDAEIDLDTALTALQAAAPPAPQAQFQDWIDSDAGGLERAHRQHRGRPQPARQYRPARRQIHQIRHVGRRRGQSIARADGYLGRAPGAAGGMEGSLRRYRPRASRRQRRNTRAPPEEPKPQPEPSELDNVVAAFDKWIELENHEPIYVTLGAVAANYLPGPPVWLGLLAPPSSAKTEILNSLSRLDKVQLATTMSPAALLSGTPKKQVHKDAKGGQGSSPRPHRRHVDPHWFVVFEFDPFVEYSNDIIESGRLRLWLGFFGRGCVFLFCRFDRADDIRVANSSIPIAFLARRNIIAHAID